MIKTLVKCEGIVASLVRFQFCSPPPLLSVLRAAVFGEWAVYLKLLGDLGSVQEESGAETVDRTEGGCRDQTRQLESDGERWVCAC